MPPEHAEPGSAEDWLRYARSDLALARQPLAAGVIPQALCFHAQQAAEKAIKAVLNNLGIEFPFTHDIAHLITVAVAAGLTWPQDLDVAAELTEYAVELRYPGAHTEATESDLARAVAIAGRVVAWAESAVHGK